MEEAGVVPPLPSPDPAPSQSGEGTHLLLPRSGTRGAEHDRAAVPVPHGLAEPRGSPAAGPCPASSVTPAREPRAGTRVLRGPALGVCPSPQGRGTRQQQGGGTEVGISDVGKGEI